jgi:hypothetical protein
MTDVSLSASDRRCTMQQATASSCSRNNQRQTRQRQHATGHSKKKKEGQPINNRKNQQQAKINKTIEHTYNVANKEEEEECMSTRFTQISMQEIPNMAECYFSSTLL